LGYGATGRDIGWAVVDTGIRGDHPHFQKYQNIKQQWDCTASGTPVASHPGEATFNSMDQHGHGTHVAGTIAGWLKVPFTAGEEPRLFAGMAPNAEIYGFRVLDKQGNGKDSWIIKALDLIADINESAGRLLIAGVNLSLGGNFDPSVYGCGHTPLCEELRRLWNQGVLVCLAAGNEGYAVLEAAHGEIPANMALSIGDPANLDEAIAVGSIHKTNPHTYGISYFSSRGPTADGRRKPDLVAPGEHILSGFHDFDSSKPSPKFTVKDLYIEMSGTSMATPHVSGILAAFLSIRREFIGYPDRVKRLLLDNCTDLMRDPYFQGQGMPNLVKMLANS
jgi:subtilisin family serine protease